MRITWVAVVLLAAGCGSRDTPSRETRESQFARAMTGLALIGHSTTWGREELSKEETYRIDKATKLTGDSWLLQVRMRIGGDKDIPLPVPVFVRWAGDTPMIQLTDAGLPGLGTFSARVLLYGEQYAGVWSGGDHGGQLFGRIQKTSNQ